MSGEKEVTISSVIPTLRHINTLCGGDTEADELGKKIKGDITNYFRTRLEPDEELLIFLCIAEMLDPRYLDLVKANSATEGERVSTKEFVCRDRY